MEIFNQSDMCDVVAAGQWHVPGTPEQLGADVVVPRPRPLRASLHDTRHKDQQEVSQLLRTHHRTGEKSVMWRSLCVLMWHLFNAYITFKAVV